MKWCIALAIVAFLYVVPSTAIKCLECFGVKDERECKEKGKIRQCRFNQDACEIELREHEGWGGSVLIYKQCKQSKACDNNYVQNPRDAWAPTQCNPDDFNNVCRCCCYEDLCNVARDTCFTRSTGGCAHQPTTIPRGSVYCTNGREFNSVCTVTCNAGSRLDGQASTYCCSDGSWSYPLAQCLDIQCPPRYAIANGWMICSNGQSTGSQCKAYCRPGYNMVGSVTSKCLPSGFWDSYPPRCEPLKCPPRGTIQGGSVTCTDESNLQSRCEAVCDGFRRLDGIVHSYCQDNGEWSHDLPTCHLIECPVRGNIVNGVVTCSLGTQVTSSCAAVCDEGYAADGAVNSVCLPTGYWSEPLPRCQRIMCPARGKVVNGEVSCTNDAYAGSVCSVICDYGSILIGSDVSECLSTGEWSVPLPECQRIECPPRGTILNGVVSCSNKHYEGSRCTARCNMGYEIFGAGESTCLPSGEWSEPLPSCSRIECPEIDWSYEPGFMTCTDSNYYGSVCSFTCSEGLTLKGAPSVSCRINGQWTTRPPTCVVISCRNRGRVANGDVVCSDGTSLGSVCDVTCREGYAMTGPATSECVNPGRWSRPLPACRPISCPPRGRLPGGSVSCTDGNRYGSVCTATCDYGYNSYGVMISECLASGEWDVPLPTCTAAPCPPQDDLANGEMTCSSSWDVSSVCTFSCDRANDYELYPPGRTSNLCRPDSQWSVPQPCCARRCPPYAVMDIVMVLDSSSSIGKDSWVQLTDFVRGIIRSFVVAPDAVNFAIFRYNKVIDEDSQIFLNSYPGDLEGLVGAFGEIPYDGSGTNTGLGLSHALRVSLAPENGNRPGVKDLVFVITDGKAGDEVSKPAADIRATGATILVLGIMPNKGSLDEDELRDIAGADENVVIAREGFAGLGADFALTLSRNLCGNPCKY